jgi:hypothetical protein
MATARATTVAVAALLGGGAICNIAAGDERSADAVREPSPPVSVDDELVVIGRLGELRHELELAEAAVYDRFNAINSTDKLDVHCREAAVTGSRIARRDCRSNAWREEGANRAAAQLCELQGVGIQGAYCSDPAQYRARQLYMQGVLNREIEQLAITDDGLKQALARLGQAQQQYAQQTGTALTSTRSVEVPPGGDGLPFGAKQMFEVLMGRETWDHTLTQRTFTLAHVAGHVRAMRLECAGSRRQLEYQDGVDWTVPSDWGRCTLLVDAQRDTTFALLEFE